jgi:hypothetical protein
MSPRMQYDLDLFRDLVKKGHTKKEIMAAMSIKYLATFNSLKLKLMDTDGKYYSAKERSNKVQKVTIGKNNNLTLSSKMLEDSAFQAGDIFEIKNTKNKITLTLVGG